MLGALRLLDPTTRLPLKQPFTISAATLQPLANDGTPVGSAFRLRPNDAQFRRNSRGDFIILRAPGFETYTRAFDLIPNIARVALGLQIFDSTGNYLPLMTTVNLPRDAAPERAGLTDSLFQPATFALFLAPSAPTEPGWAVIRATVRERVTQNNADAGGARLPWTHLQVTDAQSDALMARGMADARGEALLAVPGILITMPANDSEAVLTREVSVKIQGAFDAALEKVSDAAVRNRVNPNPDYLPPAETQIQFKPARVKPGSTAVSDTINLAAGRTIVCEIWI